ncbi:hypothetical protein DS831_04505 [Bombilactobacillus bombi]|uniref:DUF4352 domain-containing protein n=2 Tax=Bombilactobacillus bombi TaxID=1303590 RepID=A0A3R6XWH8_9LACO|nr:hypothetical protein DS831_04505 [Bombilactobacillus bombi]
MHKQSKTPKGGKSFYKVWWFWIIAVALAIILFAAHSGSNTSGSSNSSDTKTEKATGHTTTSEEKGNITSNQKAKGNSLEIEDESTPVLSKKIYKLNFSDSNWNAATVKVNKVSVFKVKPFVYDSESKKKAEGIIILNISVKANRDISNTYPDQGTVITDDGQQQEAQLLSITGYTTNWGGDIAKDATKTGDVIIPVEKLNKTDQFKSLRYKFNSSYDTDDYDDENANHDYDITIQLN